MFYTELVRRHLKPVALDGCRNRFQTGAPAALTKFIGVNEIIRSLTALGAIKRHRPGHAANAEPASTGLTFDPLSEFARYVSLRIRFIWSSRFGGFEEKRPGTQPHSQARYSVD